MTGNPYQELAQRLDQLPNGFPATEDGAELRLLEKLYTPDEAALAAQLKLKLETPAEIAERLQGSELDTDARSIKQTLKGMARKGLISAGKTERGMCFSLMPFVVGVYEMQIGRIDEELARLFEDYYVQAFGETLRIEPKFHRVVPIGETIQIDMEVRPFESATEIVNQAEAWGVLDCICRKQKALIGDPCEHPVEVCMAFSPVPGTFDHSDVVRALTHQEALDTLQLAARAGLVHTVSNSQEGNYYICNCCTCSCGLLRGMAEMGIANVVAHSAFVNYIDEDICTACETCVDYCQFEALELSGGFMQVNTIRCVGCGVCVPACPEDALKLVRRPPEQMPFIPQNEEIWREERAMARGIDIEEVM
ncbi:MAG: 4Fe-4S binding protein [Chloroflexota bacterium]|nr:4Fe-4S binding protein [Chloroflexota bacterium]